MILVVGASGQLGRRTVRRLLAGGQRVRAVSRDPRKLGEARTLGADTAQADLVDPRSLDAACNGVDTVFAAAHSMMGTGQYASAAVDDAGHRALVDAAKRAGVRRFVYTSAMFATPHHPIDFVRTKADIEGYVASSGLSFAILRPSAFMEWHVHEFLGKSIVASGKATIFGRGTNPMNFVCADDVAAVATAAIADTASADRLDVGGPDNVSRHDVIAMYEEALGRRASVRHVPIVVVKSMVPIVRPFHAGLARILDVTAWSETADQRFYIAASKPRYARPLTSVREFVQRSVAAATSVDQA